MKSSRHSSPPASMPLSARRRRAFVLITLLTPWAFLLLLEVSLRAFGYGPDLSLFTTIDAAGRTYHVMNPQVKGRYFAGSSFNPTTSQDLFLVPKPAGTFRIFCFGGSTMIGYPYWYNGAPSTFLRDRLTRLFPQRKIEIINVGMTATNSFTVVDMARDLIEYQPDLFIVYDGHNEFYGALGVASHESVGGFRWTTRLYLRLIHYRTFLLLRDLSGRIAHLFGGSSEGELTGTMMEYLARGKYVPYGSSLYAHGLSTFEDNLQELRALCEDSNIPLILSTQASNLRTLPPFVSGDPPGKSPEERTRFTEHYDRGTTLYAAGRFQEALTAFREAEALDSLRADTQYSIARCLDTLGDTGPAWRAYVKARDYDQLRFRSSSDFNDAIRRMSERVAIGVADIEQIFRGSARDSIIGSELIFEHLHPRARGYFLMARAYADVMRRQGLLASLADWSAADTLQEESLWEARPMTELDEIVARRRNELLTSRWPFQQRPRPLSPVLPGDVLGTIADKIVTGKLTWEYGHVAAAEHFEAAHEYDRAADEYQALVNQYPGVVSGYLRLARVYHEMGDRKGAEQVCLRSLEIEKTARACRMLAKLANNDRRFPDAVKWFESAIALGKNPEELSEDRYNLALVLLNAGMRQRAVEELRLVTTRNPNYLPASKLLQQLSAQR